MSRGKILAVYAVIITLTVILALILAACGKRARQVVQLIPLPSTQQGQDSLEKPDDGGVLPPVMALDGCIAVSRGVSEDEPISSPGWEAYINDQTGTNGTSELNVEVDGTALTLRAYTIGEYAYAVYGQIIGADPKPLQTLIDCEVCAFGGGQDDDIPLSYFVGIADYSLGSWRWFGPFGEEDVMVTVNSETLKSRFKSPEDNFYLCVLASNAGRAASALPDAGLVADFPIELAARAISEDDDDPGGLTIEEICTWVADNLLTDPAIVTGLSASCDTSGVSLTWDTNLDPDVYIYQVLRDDLDDEESPVLLAGINAPDTDFMDSEADPAYLLSPWEVGLPGKEFQYLVRARNDAGFGGPSFVDAARSLTAPNVTATDGAYEFKIVVSWTSVEGAEEYKLYRAADEFDAPQLLSEFPPETTSYEDTEPALGEIMWYWARAVGEDVESPLGGPDSGVMLHNDLPIAVLIVDPTVGSPPLEVAFDASGSSDADGFIANYEWDWEGDGAYDDSTGSSTADHTYNSPDTYEPTVRVTDNMGATATDSATVTVTPESPTINWVSPTSALAGYDATFSAEVWGTAPLTYSWDFGDGADPDVSDEESPTVTIGAADSYEASLEVTNAVGSDTYDFTLQAIEPGPGDWWMFGREPTHNRRSPYVGAQTNNVKWQYVTMSYVNGSPVIGADGTVYIVSGNFLLALSTTGKLIWEYEMVAGSGSSPAIGADGTVYVGCGEALPNEGCLYAVKPDGTLKWQYETSYDLRSSPSIGADGTLYVGCFDDYLYAITDDGIQGSLNWRYETGGAVESSPAIGTDGTIYAGSNDNYLYAINPDGTLRWKFETGGHVESSPAIGSDGTIYVGSNDGYLYAIADDVTEGTLKWSYNASTEMPGGDVVSSPAIAADGTIYIGGGDAYVYAITDDETDGTTKWRYETDGYMRSSPAIGADGTIYIGSGGGYIYAVIDNETEGTLLWQYDDGSSVWSSPAIAADGTVYIGSRSTYLFYAFGD